MKRIDPVMRAMLKKAVEHALLDAMKDLAFRKTYFMGTSEEDMQKPCRWPETKGTCQEVISQAEGNVRNWEQVLHYLEQL